MEEDVNPLLMDINASIQALCIIYFYNNRACD